MGWLNTLFQRDKPKDDSALGRSRGRNSSFFRANDLQPTTFVVVNLTDNPIDIQVFNEDPEELGYYDNDDETNAEDSDFFNGFEPISIQQCLLTGQEWLYTSTSGLIDSRVGTIKVESDSKTYFADGQRLITSDETDDVADLVVSMEAGKDEETVFDDLGGMHMDESGKLFDLEEQEEEEEEEEKEDMSTIRKAAWKQAEEEIEMMDIETHTDPQTGILIVELILEEKPKKFLQKKLSKQGRADQQATLEASLTMLECNLRFGGASGGADLTNDDSFEESTDKPSLLGERPSIATRQVSGVSVLSNQSSLIGKRPSVASRQSSGASASMASRQRRRSSGMSMASSMAGDLASVADASVYSVATHQTGTSTVRESRRKRGAHKKKKNGIGNSNNKKNKGKGMTLGGLDAYLAKQKPPHMARSTNPYGF